MKISITVRGPIQHVGSGLTAPERVETMWGFVLANVSPGKEPEFFSNLGSIQQIRHVFYLFDDYEYLLEVEADTAQELTKVMTNHVRHLPGVERTATFIEGNAQEFHPVEREEPGALNPETSLF